MKEKFLIWLLQQGTSTVLLIVLTGVVVYFGNYTITTAIPEHLRTIQSGYEKQEAAHSAVVDKFVTSMERQQQAIREDREMFRDSLKATIRDTIRETSKTN